MAQHKLRTLIVPKEHFLTAIMHLNSASLSKELIQRVCIHLEKDDLITMRQCSKEMNRILNERSFVIFRYLREPGNAVLFALREGERDAQIYSILLGSEREYLGWIDLYESGVDLGANCKLKPLSDQNVVSVLSDPIQNWLKVRQKVETLLCQLDEASIVQHQNNPRADHIIKHAMKSLRNFQIDTCDIIERAFLWPRCVELLLDGISLNWPERALYLVMEYARETKVFTRLTLDKLFREPFALNYTAECLRKLLFFMPKNYITPENLTDMLKHLFDYEYDFAVDAEYFHVMLDAVHYVVRDLDVVALCAKILGNLPLIAGNECLVQCFNNYCSKRDKKRWIALIKSWHEWLDIAFIHNYNTPGAEYDPSHFIKLLASYQADFMPLVNLFFIQFTTDNSNEKNTLTEQHINDFASVIRILVQSKVNVDEVIKQFNAKLEEDHVSLVPLAKSLLTL
jgi:hypothetical protein